MSRVSLRRAVCVSSERVRLAAALVASVLASQNALADSVHTNADNGFARLHFTLDPLAHAKAELAGGVLTIAFDRKVAISPASMQQGLGSYIASVREDADGQTFRLALAQSVHLHTSVSGDVIAIDLAPDSFAGIPPDLPPPPPREPTAVDVASLPALNIRVGAYSNFSRLVFDWPKKVAYAVFPGASHLTVRFEARARPELSALANVAPPWIKETGWRIDGRGTVMEFATDASSGFHSFTDGTKVVLDILAPKADAAAYKPPTDSGKPADTLKVTKLAASAAGNAQTQAVMDAAKALRTEDAPNAATAPPAENSSKPNGNATPGTASPASAATPKSSDTIPAAVPQTIPNTAPASSATPAFAQHASGGIALNFPGAAKRAAAVFIRGASAWIVLDGEQPIDSQQLKTVLGEVPVDASSGGGASVLRINLKHQEKIAAIAEGSDLKVLLAPDAASSTAAIGFVRNNDAAHTALATILPGAVHALKLADPAAGDTLIVVPSQIGRASPDERTYVEFSILPSAAGLVLAPYSDDLAVSVSASRVTIGRPNGLALAAPGQVAVESPAALARNKDGPCFLDFASWTHVPGGSFLESQRRLRAAAAGPKAEEADRAQFRLARFYLANGFSAEALGVVELIQAAHPELKSDRQLQTMRAAADFMLGRYRDARNDIAGSVFDGDRHAAVWRGLIEAAQMNWEPARKNFALAAPVLRRYPPQWQASVRIADARAALAADSIEAADSDLAVLPDPLPKPLVMEAQLVRAELMAAEGRYDDAHAIFRSIESGNVGRSSAEAVYADVEAGLAARAISQDQAIDALEQLRFRWRGDALELEALRKLGALYFAKQRWHQGLATLRIASQNFPNEDLAREAQDDMRATFEALFLKGGAERMPPIQALGLFYDFIDLTPIGPNGDEMIRHMADRLVAVDLLEPAAALLDYQVTKRLDGIARAQVATRLAMIDLLDHKPKEALEALRTSQVSGLPPDVLHQRTILQARALAGLKQWDQALDMIATDDSDDSRRLRADIYWESGSWELAGEKAEALAMPVSTDTKPLADDARASVLRAAIAYTLASDETGLERLRKGFGEKMGASRDANTFQLVTQKLDTEGTAFRDMAGRIASVDTLEAFMRDFRKRYDAGRMTN
jgi:tetratricopeptide (TPR) repeat protein